MPVIGNRMCNCSFGMGGTAFNKKTGKRPRAGNGSDIGAGSGACGRMTR
jgi:hypothetical protein